MRLLRNGSLAMLCIVAACGDSITGPIVMSVSEIRTLIIEIAAALDATDSPFYLHESALLFSVQGGMPPETYDGEADCPEGGRVTNAGGGEVSETILNVTFTQTFEDCGTANYTVNGSHHVTVNGSASGDTLRIEMDLDGELTVEASGDRRGTCVMDYGYTITDSPAASSFQPRGTICGEDILRITGVPVSF